MSKYLVALFNNTDENIQFVNRENSADDQNMQPQSMFTTDVHFNIPDNSDSAKYFNDHHMSLQIAGGETLFSFWDDDDRDYKLFCCTGTDWEHTTTDMPGSYPKGDRVDVAIVLSKPDGNYRIDALPAQALV